MSRPTIARKVGLGLGVALLLGVLAIGRRNHPAESSSPTDALGFAGSDFVRLEYQSLRSESEQARAAQQSTLQWTLAAMAAVLTGGLVLVGQGEPGALARDETGALFILVFGVALPSVSLLSFLAWCGELIRMERAGGYLRGLEAWLATRAQPGPAPLRWETHILRSVGKGGKQQIGYLGPLGLYAGAYLTSWMILAYGMTRRSFAPEDEVWRTLAFVGIGVAATGGIAVIVYVVKKIQHMGTASKKYAEVDPAAIAP